VAEGAGISGRRTSGKVAGRSREKKRTREAVAGGSPGPARGEETAKKGQGYQSEAPR